jgi:GT2 family glycosyltransferase
MENLPKVSITLLACNKAVITELCLKSLLKTDYPNVELWMVDNGSTDSTSELFDTYEKKLSSEKNWEIKRVTYPENAGAIEGRNVALKSFGGDYLLMLDNDIVAYSPDWLKKMVARMEQDKTIGALGVKLLFPKPHGMIQCAGCDVTPTGRVVFSGRGANDTDREFCIEREVQCLISACMIMPAKVVKEVGLLDMAYHPVQFEDIDYCYRIREKGYRIIYYPDVKMYHYENITTDGTSGINYKYVTVKNGIEFKKRWKHMYSTENGPDDDSVTWLDLPKISWQDIQDSLK